jgi:uncharacterized protein YejL (UPF0352 family)
MVSTALKRKYPYKGAIMRVGSIITALLAAVLVAASTCAALAEEISREQLKGLDEQVQEIKSDVLAIAAELNQLEERLLFPSNTQIAIFVSVPRDAKFRLDSVQIHLGGKPVARHIYSFKELEALQKGGIQRIYTGNVRSGVHDLQVVAAGKSGTGNFSLDEKFAVTKAVGPKIVELTIGADRIAIKDE